jgi:hypothetical protein
MAISFRYKRRSCNRDRQFIFRDLTCDKTHAGTVSTPLLLQERLDSHLLICPSCQSVAPVVVDRSGKSVAFKGRPASNEGRIMIVISRETGCGGRFGVVARFLRADERR